MNGRGQRKFQYAVIYFQPSLLKGTPAEPIGVLVQRGPNMFLVQESGFLEGSEIAREVVEALPRIIQNEARAFQGQPDKMLEKLSATNRFNVFFGPTQVRSSETSLEECAFSLFGSEIVGGNAREGGSAKQGSRTGRAIWMPVPATV